MRVMATCTLNLPVNSDDYEMQPVAIVPVEHIMVLARSLISGEHGIGIAS